MLQPPWLSPWRRPDGYRSPTGSSSGLPGERAVSVNMADSLWCTGREPKSSLSCYLLPFHSSLLCFQLFYLARTLPMNHCLVTQRFPGRLEEAHWIKPAFFFSSPTKQTFTCGLHASQSDLWSYTRPIWGQTRLLIHKVHSTPHATRKGSLRKCAKCSLGMYVIKSCSWLVCRCVNQTMWLLWVGRQAAVREDVSGKLNERANMWTSTKSRLS